MVQNLSANAGDIGLIPGLGRLHIPWGNWATTTEPAFYSPCSATEEATAKRDLHIAAREQPQLTAIRETLHAATKTPHCQK